MFPAPVHALTNEFVLVEDYIEGVPISAVLKVRAHAQRKEQAGNAAWL